MIAVLASVLIAGPDPTAEQTLRYIAEQTRLLWWYVAATLIMAVATCVALLQERFRSALARSDLSVSLGPTVATPFGSPSHLAHYLRLLVTNGSANAARDVEVVVERIRRTDAAAPPQAQPERIFGLNLEWSHFPGQAVMPQIAADSSRTVDIGHVLRPADRAQHRNAGDPHCEDKSSVPITQTIFKLGTVRDPYSRDHLLEPGDWYVDLRISAANMPGRRVALRLRITGQWHDDPAVFKRADIALEVQ